MSEERLKVLEMVKDGSITTEDALKLLQGLDESDDRNNRREPNRENRGRHRDYGNGYNGHLRRNDFGWVNDLRDTIMESVKTVSSQFEGDINSPFDFGQPNIMYTCTSDGEISEIKSLRLSGKNDKIEIIAAEDNFIKIDAIFKAKSGMDPHIYFEQKEGHYNFLYDINAVYAMGLRVHVPKVKIDDLYAETKNADIYINGVKADTTDIITKNATIQVENFNGIYMNLETKNAPIYLNNSFCSEIEAKTSNAKIELRTINAGSARLQTNNAAIKTDFADIRYIMAKTSNASIRFFNMADITRTQYPQYSVEGYTSNGNITLDLPNGANAALKLNATTSAGHINADLRNLVYFTSEKNYIDAKSLNYDDSLQKLDIILQTSNANISINS